MCSFHSRAVWHSLNVPQVCICISGEKNHGKIGKIPLGLENFHLPVDKNFKVTTFVTRSNCKILFQKIIDSYQYLEIADC